MEAQHTVLIGGGDFTPDDDRDWPDFTIEIQWRNRKTSEKGVERLLASGEPHPGLLFAVERGDPRGAANLLLAALRDDDGEYETVDGEEKQKLGTSSLDRFDLLIFDRERKIPVQAISKVLQALYGEYVNRRRPSGVEPVPTGQPAPSSAGRSTRGRTSTARRSGKASTSRAVIPATA